jgi:hypothetical protein
VTTLVSVAKPAQSVWPMMGMYVLYRIFK